MDSTQRRVKKRVLSGGKIAFWQISWLDSSYNTDLLVQQTARHLNFTACKREPIYSTGKKLGYWSLIFQFKRADYLCANSHSRWIQALSFQHSWEGEAIVMLHFGKEWMQEDQEVTNSLQDQALPVWENRSGHTWANVGVQQLWGPTNLMR